MIEGINSLKLIRVKCSSDQKLRWTPISLPRSRDSFTWSELEINFNSDPFCIECTYTYQTKFNLNLTWFWHLFDVITTRITCLKDAQISRAPCLSNESFSHWKFNWIFIRTMISVKIGLTFQDKTLVRLFTCIQSQNHAWRWNEMNHEAVFIMITESSNWIESSLTIEAAFESFKGCDTLSTTLFAWSNLTKCLVDAMILVQKVRTVYSFK